MHDECLNTNAARLDRHVHTGSHSRTAPKCRLTTYVYCMEIYNWPRILLLTSSPAGPLCPFEREWRHSDATGDVLGRLGRAPHSITPI